MATLGLLDKLKRIVSRRKNSDGYDLFDEDIAEMDAAGTDSSSGGTRGAADPPSAPDEDSDGMGGAAEDGDDYEDGEDRDEDQGNDDDGPKRSRTIAFLAATFLLVGLFVGGAGWWFLGGPESELATRKDEMAETAIPAATFILPPRRGGKVSSPNEPEDAGERHEKSRGHGSDRAEAPPSSAPGPDTGNRRDIVPRNVGERPPRRAGDVKRAKTAHGRKAGGGTRSGDEIAAPRKSRLEVEYGLSEGEPEPGFGVIASAASLILKDQLPDLGDGGASGEAIDPDSPESPKLEEVHAGHGDETTRATMAKVDGGEEASWRLHARPFHGEGNRVAIVVTEMGMSKLATEAVIAKFPPDVSLAFSPYGSTAGALAARARKRGHEVWLSLPMEPIDFPFVDPGPLALLTTVEREENDTRMNKVLSTVRGYVGVTTDYGSLFTAVSDYYKPVLETLKEKGIAVLDVAGATRSLTPAIGGAIGLAWQKKHMTIGETADRNAVAEALRTLEKMARSRNATIATVRPYPFVLKQVAEWLETVGSKGIALAPVSALLHKPATG